MTNLARRPVSARRAFALALDLAVRRDALQSLVIPLLLRAPWLVALALIPTPGDTEVPGRAGLLWLAALVGDALTDLTVNSMLRIRARSAYGGARGTRLAPATECYARGLARVPWLFLTEITRGLLIAAGLALLVLPGLWTSFRLAFATEAVVLDQPHLSAAVRCSYRLTARRLGGWLALLLLSAGCVVTMWFGVAAILLAARAPESWFSVGFLAAIAIWPLIQYAWTFFYLDLVDAESPGIEVGPLYAATWPAPAPAAESAGTAATGPAGPAVPDGQTEAHVPPPTEDAEGGSAQA